jgi:ankyrin repeat protein
MAEQSGRTPGGLSTNNLFQPPPATVFASNKPVQVDIWTAAKRGDVETIRTLVEDNCMDVNIGDEDGSTPLHWAAYFDRVQVVEYLLRKEAYIDAVNQKEGQTPLHWACIGKSTKTIFLLAQEGADMTKCDKRGYTCLIYCCQYGNALATHFFVQRGLSVTQTDNEGHTPLHWAAYQNQEPVARLLLLLGADIHAADSAGLTALHWSALKGHTDMVQFLLANGADVKAMDKDGFTAEDLARQKNMRGAIALLQNPPRPEHEKMCWRLWFSYPWLMVPIIFFVLDSLGFLPAVVVVVGLIYLSKRLLGHLWLGKDTNNPFFMSVMASSYALSTWYYFVHIYSLTNHFTILTMTFIAVNCFWSLLFLYLVRSDPGFLPLDPRGVERIYEMVNKGVEEIPQLCATCMIARPIRSKHCRSCNRCVARMDHHCTWLNNCVGFNNHISFLLVLFLVISLHSVFVYLCLQVCATYAAGPTIWALHKAVPFYFANEPLTFCLLIYHLFNALWEFYVFYQQVTCVLNNITANEIINASRYPYLRSKDTNRFFNPFDNGKSANLAEFFFAKMDYYRLFSLPHSRGPAYV